MKNKNYKILVLSDLKNSTDNLLLNTVSLAKMIGAEIDFFYVKKPIDIVKKENQLSAKRTINKDHFDTDKKIKSLLEPISIDYNQKINASFSFGNVKEEILKQIKKVNPDIIVLGKRKPFALKLIGDNITDFILKNFKGSLFIAGDSNGLKPNNNVRIGVLEDVNASLNMPFANDILKHSNKPLKAFKITDKSENNNELVSNKDVIEYVFEKNDNSVNNLSNYLDKNGINLFCVNKDSNNVTSKTANVDFSFKELMKKVDVSLLLSNN